MKSRLSLKTFLFCLVPSIAILYFAPRWPDFAKSLWPSMPEMANEKIPKNLGWTGLLLAGGLFLMAFVGHLLSPEYAAKRSRRAIPELLRGLIRYGVLAFCVAMILHFVWGESVTPIFGALGIGGIALGFALQETLSNFFAGVALLLDQPFAQGDWIKIGDRAEGEVEQVTWRATKIRTRDNDYQIFPNSVVAKEVIVNFRQPSLVHAIRLGIGTSYDDAPDKVKRVILEVVGNVSKVMKKPEPVVHLKVYADFSINYELKCYIEDYERRPMIEDDVMHRIWYAFRRENINIPFPIQTVYEHHIPYTAPLEKQKSVELEKILGTVPIFATLGKEEVSSLAQASRVLDYGRGEMVIRQGDPGDTMFMIVAGSARVSIHAEDGSEKVVARLSAGDVFGEMSLLTGDPRTASVMAEDAVILVAVSKGALLPILSARPEFAEKIAEIITLRKQGLGRAQAESALEASQGAEAKSATQSLLGRIRSFFRI